MDSPLGFHSIDAVARKTGLSAHVIRIWEKRYRAVQPARSASNRRQYSDEEVERLSLLRSLTQSGQSIGYVAKLPTEKLRSLATAPAATADEPRPPRFESAAPSPAALLDESLTAVRSLDSRALAMALKRAEFALGTQGMLQRVAAPLARTLGELWREGSITAAHEHFASALLRTHLAQTATTFAGSAHQPVLIVATPARQLHELGALLAGALAANLGWHVTYLGASLPAAEIAAAAVQNQARAVALSLVYPDDDPQLESELIRLREALPPHMALIAGGRAVPAYRTALERVGAFPATDLSELGAVLDRLRTTPSSSSDTHGLES
jgi:DNA-binding transcriptional MerR regulator/methylmalonyl-CoA mutase cobalamin-binding subunit